MTDNWRFIVEMVVLGVPLWWGAIRSYFIFREFPPHIHENGHVRYPRGYEPGIVQSIRTLPDGRD